MEHKIYSMNKEQQTEEKEPCMPKGQEVIFIKTRKSDEKIHDLVSEMKAVAKATDVEVVDVIVDFTEHAIIAPYTLEGDEE